VEAWTLLPSPVGDLLVTADGAALTAVLFTPHKGSDAYHRRLLASGASAPAHPVLAATRIQLGEYFAGDRRAFDLTLEPHGTRFQQRVWAALRQIPYGATASYGDLARRLGLGPGASRAVGLANGANPLSVVIPCHRVIGADGSLTGYGGGLERKRFLLDLERGALF
jgi:methylated-DNA-[protein]-cysteine S-methyltransferase